MASSSNGASKMRPDFPASAVSVHGDKDYVLDSCHVIAAPLNRHLRRYQRQGVKFLYRRCFSTSSSSNHDSVKQTEDKFWFWFSFPNDQTQAVFLSLQSGAILADDMGLGKTVQVIGLISALLKRTHVAEYDLAACRRVRFGSGEDGGERGGRAAAGMFLIVCPASVLRNWEQEFETWGYFVLAKYYK